MDIQIQSALISVFYKDGLDEIVRHLHSLGIAIYSTGGTREMIEAMGIPVIKVEDVTGYPSILDGRVKTLHPKIFGGILATQTPVHEEQLRQYDIPRFDLVVVDLYPFEETIASTDDEDAIIEKIDIGGISLIRAAAKNFQSTLIIPSRSCYGTLRSILAESNGVSTLSQRRHMAVEAFHVSSHYDAAIFTHFASEHKKTEVFKQSVSHPYVLRYGENPHQTAVFHGDLSRIVEKLSGKELSYNNLVDVDAAIRLIHEFWNESPTFAVIKHTNACGVASRHSALEAWKGALEADPVSAFGGIIICNCEVDAATAREIDQIFYEILVAPSFTDEALAILQLKSKRTLLRVKTTAQTEMQFRSLLHGVLVQQTDLNVSSNADSRVVTESTPSDKQWSDLLFAEKCVKQIKSNAIVLVRDNQLLGMGSGQTSRIDACKQAIEKAIRAGFSLEGAVLASDAFFPFPDCVEVAHGHGIQAVIQPGGSVKDHLSVDYCNAHGIAMVMTGIRHFLH